MILITGGRGQGKTEYALHTFQFSEAELTDGAVCNPEAALSARCITAYHALVRRLLADGRDPVAFTERLCTENPDAVILLDEIGCGIVPLEKNDRILREQTGRCGCILAARAETVIRMVCGIPAAIKGELP